MPPPKAGGDQPVPASKAKGGAKGAEKKATDGPMGVSWYIWGGAAAVGLYLYFRSRSAKPAPAASLVGAQAGGLTPVVGNPPSISTQGTTMEQWGQAAQQAAAGAGVDPLVAEQAIANFIAGTPLDAAETTALDAMLKSTGPPPAATTTTTTGKAPALPTQNLYASGFGAPEPGVPTGTATVGAPGYWQNAAETITTTDGQIFQEITSGQMFDSMFGSGQPLYYQPSPGQFVAYGAPNKQKFPGPHSVSWPGLPTVNAPAGYDPAIHPLLGTPVFYKASAPPPTTVRS